METRSSGKKQAELLILIAVVAIVLLLVMGAVGPGSWIAKKWDASQGTTSQQSAPPAAGTSVVGGPSLSAARIEAILTNAGSPAQGTGQTFYNDSITYNVDDSVALAFFKHESSFGTRGEATQSMSIGNLRCINGYTCQDGYAWFPSWQSGIDAWYRLISGPYYAGGGLTTIPQIIPKYAPNSDGNSESSYISAVENDMQSWRNA